MYCGCRTRCASTADTSNHPPQSRGLQEFGQDGHMKPSASYQRVVEVTEALMKFTLLTRVCSTYLVDRKSERRKCAEALSKLVNQRGI